MPLRVWLHSPELASRAQTLGEFCRYGTTLPPALSELAILIVGAHWRASYEFQVHAQAARHAGLDCAILDDLSAGSRPTTMSKNETALYEFTTALLSVHRVPEDIYEIARQTLGETTLVEIVGILGYYSLICMTIKYPSEQSRRILGAARGNVGSWRSMRTRSTMPFWRCYG